MQKMKSSTQEAPRAYHCVLCGCPLHFTPDTFEPPEDELISNTPSHNQQVRRTNKQMTSAQLLFDDDEDEDFDDIMSSTLSPVPHPSEHSVQSVSEERMFTDTMTIHGSLSPASIPTPIEYGILTDTAVPSKPKTPMRKRFASRQSPLISLRQPAQTTPICTVQLHSTTHLSFAESRSPFHFSELPATFAAHELSRGSIDGRDSAGPWGLSKKPLYSPRMVEPLVEWCKKWEVEFPLCSKCFLIVDTSLADLLSNMTDDYRKERIMYQKYIEFTITNTVDDDIQQELVAIEALEEEVRRMQVENEHLRRQKDVLAECLVTDTKYYRSHASALAATTRLCAGLLDRAEWFGDRRSMAEQWGEWQLGESVDEVFAVGWMDDDVTVHGIPIIETLQAVCG